MGDRPDRRPAPHASRATASPGRPSWTTGHGPSGTAKTLTATLLGKHTGRDVFRVDLSRTVSQYIGETEKNLSRLFNKAESKDWIVFFDEADALFGKRTEIHHAQDRFANREVAYLLQWIESHDDLVILASNQRANIDEAFARRLQSIVHFPMLRPDGRYQIWLRTFPPQIELAPDIDWRQVAARHELTGAAILNITHFCAIDLLARQERRLDLRTLEAAIQREYVKEERSCSAPPRAPRTSRNDGRPGLRPDQHHRRRTDDPPVRPISRFACFPDLGRRTWTSGRSATSARVPRSSIDAACRTRAEHQDMLHCTTQGRVTVASPVNSPLSAKGAVVPSISDTIAKFKRFSVQVQPAGGASEAHRLAAMDAFGRNPGDLRALIHIPAGLPAGAPLVVVLHGCTQSAGAYDRGSGWSTLADRFGFAVLYPEQQRGNNPNLCFNWFVPADTRRGGGEAESIREMVVAAIERHRLDASRVFVTGLSAGGAMTSVMLATHPEMFAAGVIIAGLPYGTAASVPEALERMRGHGHDRAALSERVRAASAHRGRWPVVSVWQGTADMTVNAVNAAMIVDQWRGVHGVGSSAITDRIDGQVHRAWRDEAGRLAVEEYVVARLPMARRSRPRATKPAAFPVPTCSMLESPPPIGSRHHGASSPPPPRCGSVPPQTRRGLPRPGQGRQRRNPSTRGG